MFNSNNLNRLENEYYEYYTIKSGDNLYQIARKYNINPELLSSLNGLNMNDYIYPGQMIMIPKSGYSYYLTKEGDTIDTVANTFGISVGDLLKNNKVLYLLDGQLLVKKNWYIFFFFFGILLIVGDYRWC